MKIGLLTYHNSMNYGAVLQTYATCRALQELGHEVELINLRQDEHKKGRSFIFWGKIRAFNKFYKQHYPVESKLYKSYQSLKEAEPDYDCLLVGSDQTWNPRISRDKKMAYFLDFGSKNTIRLSYASSIGEEEWPPEYKDDIESVKNALSRFKAISIREETGKNILQKVFGFDSTVVVDPTLLHRDYHELTGDIKPNREIICYILNRFPSVLAKAKVMCQYAGGKGKMISTIRPVSGFKYVYPPSIESWIRYIAGAKFVVTDSFHGVAFCILYRKDFVVITVDNGRNSRMKNLIDKVGLGDRFYHDTDEIDYERLLNTQINYQEVYQKLDRESSWDFLRSNLTK